MLNTVNDLNGWTVAAVGGSNYTAQMLKHPNIGNAQFVLAKDVPNNVSALEGVLNGKYDAAILVTTQPAKVFDTPGIKENLPKLKMLPVPADLSDRISKFYPGKASLTYQAMGDGGMNVSTFQVMSVMLAANYSKGPYAEAIDHFRTCVVENASEIASRPRTSPAWRFIANATKNGIPPTGNWELWTLPGKPAAPAPKKKN